MIGLKERERGQMGSTEMELTSLYTMGPPELKE